MKIRIIFYCFFFLISIDAIAEFRLENWKNHTSYLQATAVSVDSKSRIWAGSTGGVFVYDSEANDYLKFNNLNGLLGIEVSAINCDKSSKEVFIWNRRWYSYYMFRRFRMGTFS
jgi:ligand-binding sensor domain-containing protein